MRQATQAVDAGFIHQKSRLLNLTDPIRLGFCLYGYLVLPDTLTLRKLIALVGRTLLQHFLPTYLI
jgi:hypothetical protein